MDGIKVISKLRKNFTDYKNRHIKIYLYSDKTYEEEMSWHEQMLLRDDGYKEMYEDFCKEERIKQRKEKLERIIDESTNI